MIELTWIKNHEEVSENTGGTCYAEYKEYTIKRVPYSLGGYTYTVLETGFSVQNSLEKVFNHINFEMAVKLLTLAPIPMREYKQKMKKLQAMKKPFNYHQDGQHGWLAVKSKILVDLNIQDQITPYSYLSWSGTTVYLEEDQDVDTFFKAFEAMYKFKPNIHSLPAQNHSHVRYLLPYKKEALR